MKLNTRSRQSLELPGLRGTVRTDRRTASLLPRVQSGDVVALDHHDLDRSTAQGLVDAGVVAVLNAAPMLSGRYPALGPQVLTDAGLTVVDRLGPDLLLRLRDGAKVRVDGAEVWAGDERVGAGRLVDGDTVAEGMEQARQGLVVQLESFTHNATEFLRREQDLLLHGRGVPRLSVRVDGRPVVVVVDGADAVAELRSIRRYIAEQDPVLIGVDAGAERLRAAGHRPDVIVLDAAIPDEALPSAALLRHAKDVVVRCDVGSHTTLERYDRLGIRPLRFESGATPEDAGLVLAAAHDATVVVGVGAHASLEDFLDRQRPGLASTYLTRLTLGERLVDARALPQLYSGAVRPWHLLAVLLAGLVALAAAISVTPVGQEWWDALSPRLGELTTWLIHLPHTLRGIL